MFEGALSDALNLAMAQVDYHCFADNRLGWVDPFYKELCLVIAEVFVLNPVTSVKINDSLLPARLVQDVFSHIRNEHVCLVYNNFHGLTHRVHNKKAYLRVALYNSVFELEAGAVNTLQAAD